MCVCEWCLFGCVVVCQDETRRNVQTDHAGEGGGARKHHHPDAGFNSFLSANRGIVSIEFREGRVEGLPPLGKCLKMGIIY